MLIPVKKVKLLTCPKCGYEFSAADKKPLSKVVCENCQHVQYVPVAFGPYLLYTQIGSDAVSALFKAFHAESQKKVLIRIANSKQSQDSKSDSHQTNSFLEVAHDIKKISHKRLVKVLDVDCEGGHDYIAFSNIKGDLAEQLISPDKKVPQAFAVLNALEIIHALHTIRQAGIHFGQISPSNVLITRPNKLGAPSCMLLYFGQYDAVKTPQDWQKLMSFMSSERIFNPDKQDWPGDVYAIGGMLHFLLTGEIYTDRSFFDPMAETKSLRIDLERKGVDSDLARLIERMLERDSKPRDISAKELIDQLKSIYNKLMHSDNFKPRTDNLPGPGIPVLEG